MAARTNHSTPCNRVPDGTRFLFALVRERARREMCKTNYQPNRQKRKPLPDFKDFDRNAPLKRASRIVDVTQEVLEGGQSFLGLNGANAVQIIGGVRPRGRTPPVEHA
jgi:hypothetical protein